MKKLLLWILILTLAACALAEPKALLEQIGEPLYQTAYEALEAGETVARGSSGDTALALQKLLIALGQDISADGAVGSRTQAAWQSVQETYGLEKTDAVDADAFCALAECLAVHTLGEAARDAVGERFDRLQAFDCRANGHNYEAWQRFTEMGDSEAAESCALPVTGGELYHNEDYMDSEIRILLTAPENTFVRILAEDGTPVAGVFLPDGETYTVKLPEGAYRIHAGTGSLWFGETDGFGQEGSYEAFSMNGSECLNTQAGNQYALDIHSEEAMDAETFDMLPIAWEEF